MKLKLNGRVRFVVFWNDIDLVMEFFGEDKDAADKFCTNAARCGHAWLEQHDELEGSTGWTRYVVTQLDY